MFVARSGEYVAQLKHLTVENIRKQAGKCQQGSSRLTLQIEGNSELLIPQLIFIRSVRHHPPLSDMEGAGLEKTVLEQMATENWTFVLVGEWRKRKLIL